MQTQIDNNISPDHIMIRLKNSTLQAHKNLEKSTCFQRLFADDYQVDEYAQLLAGFYGYFASIEPLVFTELLSEYQGSLQYRSKLKLLQKDLAILNIASDTLDICTNLPVLNSFAQKLGALYVLEGSTLGGRIISRHLRKLFGENIGNALNYYQSYGDLLDTEWRGFTALMLRYFADKDDNVHEEAVIAANATFSTLQAWVAKSS